MSKQMNSKYKATCRDCGAPIDAGEPITWHGRGKGVTCADCDALAAIGNTVSGSRDLAAQIDPALDWDDTPPNAGASISSTATATPRVRKSAQQIKSQRYIDTRDGSIVDSVPIHHIAHFEPYSGACAVGAIDTNCEQYTRRNPIAAQASGPQPVNSGALKFGANHPNADNCESCGALDELSHNDATGTALCGDCDDAATAAHDSTRAVVELAAARVKRDAEATHAPELDALAATVCDLLVTLVNCIDRLDADQCDALRSHANKNSADSASGSRRRLWQSLGRAIG